MHFINSPVGGHFILGFAVNRHLISGEQRLAQSSKKNIESDASVKEQHCNEITC